MRQPVTYIEVEDTGQRIDNFLVRVLKAVPKARIYRMLRRGEVRVNGGRVKPAYRVQAGDRVRIPPIRPPRPAAAPVRPQLIEPLLRDGVLFEDDGLLILDKPAGMAVHGGSGISVGLIEALRAVRSERFLELVHRLDRDTSGCLILARSRAALRQMHELLRQRRVRKTYQLLVSGCWPSDLGAVDLALHRYVTASGERRVRAASHGKPSRTIFHRLSAGGEATWLQARPQSGRTHQIRVHAAASGYPLLGDDKYGSVLSKAQTRQHAINRLCLHATRLSFDWQGASLRVEAPLPPAFVQIWDRLEGDGSGK